MQESAAVCAKRQRPHSRADARAQVPQQRLRPFVHKKTTSPVTSRHCSHGRRKLLLPEIWIVSNQAFAKRRSNKSWQQCIHQVQGWQALSLRCATCDVMRPRGLSASICQQQRRKQLGDPLGKDEAPTAACKQASRGGGHEGKTDARNSGNRARQLAQLGPGVPSFWKIWKSMPISDASLKAGFSASISQNVQPNDQQSAAHVHAHAPSKTSGGRYHKVVTMSDRWCDPQSQAAPKSSRTPCNGSMRARQFARLMSRCQMP